MGKKLTKDQKEFLESLDKEQLMAFLEDQDEEQAIYINGQQVKVEEYNELKKYQGKRYSIKDSYKNKKITQGDQVIEKVGEDEYIMYKEDDFVAKKRHYIIIAVLILLTVVTPLVLILGSVII